MQRLDNFHHRVWSESGGRAVHDEMLATLRTDAQSRESGGRGGQRAEGESNLKDLSAECILVAALVSALQCMQWAAQSWPVLTACTLARLQWSGQMYRQSGLCAWHLYPACSPRMPPSPAVLSVLAPLRPGPGRLVSGWCARDCRLAAVWSRDCSGRDPGHWAAAGTGWLILSVTELQSVLDCPVINMMLQCE